MCIYIYIYYIYIYVYITYIYVRVYIYILWFYICFLSLSVMLKIWVNCQDWGMVINLHRPTSGGQLQPRNIHNNVEAKNHLRQARDQQRLRASNGSMGRICWSLTSGIIHELGTCQLGLLTTY